MAVWASSWENWFLEKSKSILGLNRKHKLQKKITPDILNWHCHAALSQPCEVLSRCCNCLVSGRIKLYAGNYSSIPQELLCPSSSRREKSNHWSKAWESVVEGKQFWAKVLLAGNKATKVDCLPWGFSFPFLPKAAGARWAVLGCPEHPDIILSSLFAELKQD